MPKRTSTTGPNAIYRTKLHDLAARLGMPPQELEACIGPIIRGLAAAFVFVQKPGGSWLPLMQAKAGQDRSVQGIAETISCWVDAGVQTIIVAVAVASPKDASAVESHEFAGVRFSVLASGHLSPSETTSSATDAALA